MMIGPAPSSVLRVLLLLLAVVRPPLLPNWLCRRRAVAFAASSASEPEPEHYYLLGVSGGLQHGFPDHSKMDYHHGPPSGAADEEEEEEEGEVVRAIFLGRALVRGVKSYLDVMQHGWREYKAEPERPSINPAVVVSGCDEHANLYWVYAVDSRQLATILYNEPRFLSITPDAALVDLASNETSDSIRSLARHEIDKARKERREEGSTVGVDDEDNDAHRVVAIPIVVTVWYNGGSYVPSPTVREYNAASDRLTRVTSYPESLALWANVSDEDRVASASGLLGGAAAAAAAAGHVGTTRTTCPGDDNVQVVAAARERYWEGIRRAVRGAEADRLKSHEENAKADDGAPPFSCLKAARLGTGPGTVRINYPLTREDLSSIFEGSEYFVDFEKGTLLASVAAD